MFVFTETQELNFTQSDNMTPKQFIQKSLKVSDVHYPDMLINPRMMEDLLVEYVEYLEKNKQKWGLIAAIEPEKLTCTSTKLPNFSPNPNMID